VSRRLVHRMTYDAPVAAVRAMLDDPEFRKAVCAAQHVTRVDVRIDRDGDHAEVVVDQWQVTKGIPSFAKRFTGDETNVVQVESWSTPTSADLVVTIPGKPGDMRGTIELTQNDGVTTETVDLTIKVGIPLVGGKIESLVSDLLLNALEKEQAVGRDYLSR
jgi:hypothetical protein